MKKFGFIGAGKMASAIVHGILASKSAAPEEIVCTCGDDDTGKILSGKTGICLSASREDVVGQAETLVLACKPQQLAQLGAAGEEAKCPVLISILAGTTIARLREKFPNVGKIVRVMPNMPAQISQGISAYAPEAELSKEENAVVDSVLSAMGEYLKVSEAQLDAITAVSGSGPGYVFEFAAAMISGAKKLGFSDEEAKKLVYKTMLGSAMLLNASNLSAEELRIAVSSPGGTTLAALEVFEKSGFRHMVESALFAAKNRSIELSKL